MKELCGTLGGRPITDDELSVAKDALIQRSEDPGARG
jgi:hypothetical protein